jgi:threonine/homoserine/homoserine lactone efflux protein
MASFLFLGAWFVVQSLVFLLLLVALAARLARLGASPRLRQVLNGLGGALFIAWAVRLLRERQVAA